MSIYAAENSSFEIQIEDRFERFIGFDGKPTPLGRVYHLPVELDVPAGMHAISAVHDPLNEGGVSEEAQELMEAIMLANFETVCDVFVFGRANSEVHVYVRDVEHLETLDEKVVEVLDYYLERWQDGQK